MLPLCDVQQFLGGVKPKPLVGRGSSGAYEYSPIMEDVEFFLCVRHSGVARFSYLRKAILIALLIALVVELLMVSFWVWISELGRTQQL